MSNQNELKSVSMIIKQRQQSRSATLAPREGKSRGSTGGVSENLNPVLPPLFPNAPKATGLNPMVALEVQVYHQLAHYLRSNYSVQTGIRVESGFYVKRYTDQYQSPLALKSHLLQKLPNQKYPEELSKSTLRKPVVRKMKRKIEDLPDVDDTKEREGSKSPQKAAAVEEDEVEEEKEETNLDDEDAEEDMDEEMDMGTDYDRSYFDNGEGDDDDHDDEDGPTY